MSDDIKIEIPQEIIKIEMLPQNTFQVEMTPEGKDGNGILSITLESVTGDEIIGFEKTYRIKFTRSYLEDFVFTIHDGMRGIQGETGNGIESINLINVDGIKKTYRIQFTYGDHYDFDVLDGKTNWGFVTGDIADQHDLKEALDSKANVADLGDLADHDTVDFETEVVNKPVDYPPSPHNHDERYYTETETDAFLDTKSDKTHLHDDRYYTETEADALLDEKANIADLGDLASKDVADYDTDVVNKPSLGALADHDTIDYDTEIVNIPQTFPPSPHNHDERYYTESEMDTALSGKSDVGHIHDDRYYTETEADALLNEKSDVTHLHDDRYYTETEMDTLLDGKSDITHLHDDRYYTENEVDTLLSAKADSADLGALADHDTIDYETEIDNIPETFPPSPHNHDDRYYTETEADALLDGKSDTDHLHDDRYYTETETDALLAEKADADDVYEKTDVYTKDEADALLDTKANVADLGALADHDTVNWETEVTNIPQTFPPSSHTHDDRYYTESEIDSSLALKAPLASPSLTGTPTAPTAADGTNTTQIATTAFVQSAFKSNDAMVFKGTIGSSGATVSALPDTHYQGWTYKVATAGTYAGQVCEIGDMIICVADGTSASNADWAVIQSNVDGSVTGPSSSTDAHVALFNGTSGKVIKDSGFTIGKSVPSDAVFTDTTYSNGNGINLDGTTFSASFPTSGTPSALGTAANGSSNNVARADHVHEKPSYGNINTSGAITSDTSVANGDKIVVSDSSDSSKLIRTEIAFDGSTATKALTPKGTWESFSLPGHKHNPTDINSGYLESQIYINTHPENSGSIIPFINNDIAFLAKVGGSYSVYTTTATDYTTDTITNSGDKNINLTNAFDGSPAYSSFTVGTKAEKVVIELTLPKLMPYTQIFYIDFGAVGWRSKEIHFLARNGDVETTWTEKDSITGLENGHWYNAMRHSVSSNGTTIQGFNQIRLVLTDWNSLSPRIAQIGVIGYNSPSLNNVFMSRSVEYDILRNMIPSPTETYSLGSSTKRWKDVYAKTLNGTTIPADPKFTDTTYTNGDGISISGTTISNSGVRSIETGSSNGTISVNTNGSTEDVAVKGLGSAAYTNSSAYATSDHNHDAEYSALGHTHDDRYYTESEIDTALSGKSDTSHTHDNRYYTESEIDSLLSAKADSSDLGDLASKDTVSWNTDITDIPSTFPPSSHTHDDRYYTESEMNTKLSAKANTADLGDLASKDTVSWNSDITDIPSTFPPSSHNHDDRYYTESEIDTALALKSDKSTEVHHVYYVKGTQTASTGAWTGVLSDVEALYEGLEINYWLPYGGSGNATLNLTLKGGNTTGAVNCYCSGTSRLTTMIPANNICKLIYQTVNISGTNYTGWWLLKAWDANDMALYNYRLGYYTADSTIYRYHLLVQKDDNTLTPLSNANNSTATNKSFLDVEFKLFGHIFFWNSTVTISGGSLIESWGNVRETGLCDFRYTFNTGQNLTPYKTIYLKVVPQSNGMVKLDTSEPLVYTLPNTNDGKYYIFLGRTHNNYQIDMWDKHPIFFHDGTGIRQHLNLPLASSNYAGYMSTTDKTKLDGLNASDYATANHTHSDYTLTSVVPNDTDMAKTKYRVATKGNTGGTNVTWYYPLVKFPKSDASNYGSLIVSGRIGGWSNENISYYQALIWNRGGAGIASSDISGGATSESAYFNCVDFVIYKDDTTSEETVYLKCCNFFVFDLDLELFQMYASIIYDGTYSTDVPSGTLTAQASTSTKRLSLTDGQLLVSGENAMKSIKSITRDGTTFTFTRLDGTTGTFTQQDTTYSNGNGISLSGTTFSAAFPTSGTPSALGTAANGTSNNVARADHVHAKPSYGNINTSGAITSDTAVANGDKIIVSDNSDSSKLIRTGISFDGSTTSKALTPKGTWESFNNYSHPTGDGNLHVPANGTTNEGKFLKATGTAGTYEWDTPENTTYSNGNGINLSGTTFSAAFPTSGTPSALGTASNGTSNNVARADHVHAKPTYGNISTSGAITSDTAVASGDKIVVTDSSDSSKLIRTGISFDGSTETKALTPKGTWVSFSASGHTHDDRYYTETEVDGLLDGKSDTSHTHDDRYYTETEMDTALGLKAPLASPSLTGTPTAPTAADGTNTTQIATTAFVQSAFKANDAMIFKGTIGSSGATVTALPNTHTHGWTYKVATAGTYAGQTCEIGDMVICVKDGTSASNSDWAVIQSNVDGAVTGPASSTDAHVATFNGTSGKVIKDSGFTIGKSVPSDAVFTDTTYSNGNGISMSGTTFSADFPSSGTPAALGTASNGTSNNVARADHVHTKPTYGNINTSGAITSDTAVANGDKIVVADSSDSSKLIRTGISFDGSTTTKALTPKGTWESFSASGHTHDDRYYTESEVDTALALKSDKSQDVNHNFYVVSTQTAKTGAWTGNLPNVDALYNGLTIDYWLGQDPDGNASLNLTLKDGSTTGAVNCYYSGTTRLTTHIGKNNIMRLIYQTVAISGTSYTGWWLLKAYDTNDYATRMARAGSNVKANSVVYRYQMLFQMDENTFTPLNNVNNSLATDKTILTDVEFNPLGEILFWDSTTTINANGDLTNAARWALNFDLRYTFNCGTTLTAHKPLYLKVSLQSNGNVKLASSSPLVQTLPTERDGYLYIHLGRTYSTYQLSLYPFHKVYYHDGTAIREYANLPLVSSNYNGLMSIADKAKLDGIASGANAYTLPTASSSTKGGIKVGSNLSMDGEVLNATDTTYTNGNGISLSGTTFSAAFPSSGTPSALGTASNGSSNNVARADHVHEKPTYGNISTTGAITSDTAVASGDKIIVADSSDSSKLIRTGISFDGSTATKALTQKGTWETFNNYSHPTGDGNLHVPANGTTNSGKFLKATGTAGTYEWDTPENTTYSNGNGINLSGTTFSAAFPTSGTPSALGTASNGTSNNVARADHVHAKPTYSKSDVGLGNVTNDAQIKQSIGTAKGDLITFTGSGAPTRLGIGSAGQVLKVVDGAPAWSSDTDTDVKVTNTLANTTKYYVTGTTSDSTNTGTQSFDSGIYATTTAGQLNATTYKVNEQVTLQWNSSDSSLDFVFA